MKFPKLVEHMTTTIYDTIPSAFGATFLHTENWLNGKRLDDGAEGLWRIHDNLYDFSNFIKDHPGGPDWLIATKGTDITEAFETHHISTIPESKLVNFYIRRAQQRRYAPYTFKEGGFYRTLKKRVRENKNSIPEWPVTKSKIFTDGLLLLSFALIIAAVLCDDFYWKAIIGAFAGIFLALMSIAAHNYTHKKDNFRMHYPNLVFLRAREWRITHALSHHLYTNTANDVESLALPNFYFLPSKKHFLARYFPYIAFPAVFSFMFVGYFVRGVFNRIKFRTDGLRRSDFLPLVIPLVMFSVGYDTPDITAMLYVWILMAGGVYFTFVGIVACHHHPDNFHDGDAPRSKEEMDWGISQLDAALDRKSLNKSHVIMLVSFGDHLLHHLFPTVDQGVLPYFRSIFEETCKDFEIEVRRATQFQCTKGAFRQLARDPNPEPPKPLNKRYLQDNVKISLQ